MREVDVVGVREGLKWRLGAVAVSVGLLAWFARSMSAFAARQEEQGFGSWNTHPEAIWPAFLAFVALLGGGVLAAWRAAERDRGDVDVRPWRLRLNIDAMLSALGGLFVSFIGVVVISGAIDIAKQPMPLILGAILTPAALWLLLWCPLVVIDPRQRELKRFALGGWLPIATRVAFSDIERVDIRVMTRQGTPISYILQARLRGGQHVPIDSMGGHTPMGEVEQVRSELERRFTASA